MVSGKLCRELCRELANDLLHVGNWVMSRPYRAKNMFLGCSRGVAPSWYV